MRIRRRRRKTTYASWIEEIRAQHPWRWRWEGMKLSLEAAWAWLLDDLVWDFNEHPEGRLMHARTKVFLPEDDPRHYEDSDG